MYTFNIFSLFKKPNWPFLQGCLKPSLVDIGPVGLIRRFVKTIKPNLQSFKRYYSFKNYPSFDKLESTFPKEALCQVWLKLAPWFWRRL